MDFHCFPKPANRDRSPSGAKVYPSGRTPLLCLLLCVVCMCGIARAQRTGDQQLPPVQTNLKITKLRVNERQTPEFQDDLPEATISRLEWARISVEYETEVSRGEYTDELEFSWSVGLLPKEQRPIVMKRTVTYIDIKAGDSHAVMYLRPRFLERYYGSDRVRRNDIKVFIEVKNRGERIAWFHYPEEEPEPIKGTKNTYWWQLAEPKVRRMDGELLTRLETPFAPMDFSYYEYIKPPRYD